MFKKFFVVLIAFEVLLTCIFSSCNKFHDEIAVELDLDSKSAIVMDMNNSRILYEKEKDARLSPGSITKLVSLFVVFDEIKNGNLALDEEVIVSNLACSTLAVKVGLRSGEKMTVDNLIKCVLIASGADAMLALAEHVGGSEEEFVRMMNEKVEELGLANTHFAGCIGLENRDTYSTAYDIAIISSKITSTYPQIYDITKLQSLDIVREDSSVLTLTNTNDMLSVDGINGLKTGSTPKSGYNLAMTYNKDGKSIFFVVLNCKTLYFRKRDCKKLVEAFT